jgi:hypothetical protein
MYSLGPKNKRPRFGKIDSTRAFLHEYWSCLADGPVDVPRVAGGEAAHDDQRLSARVGRHVPGTRHNCE